MFIRALVLVGLLGCGSDKSEDGFLLVSSRSALEKEWRVTGDAGADPQNPSPLATYTDAFQVCDKAKLDVHVSLDGLFSVRLTRDFDWVTHISKLTFGGKVLLDSGRPKEVTMERLPYATTTLTLGDGKPPAPGTTYTGDLVFSLDQMAPTGKALEVSDEHMVDEGKWRKLKPSAWKLEIAYPDDAARAKLAERERAAIELKELDRRLSLEERTIADARTMKFDTAKEFVKFVDGLIAERDARKKIVGNPNTLQPIAVKIECAKP